MFSRPSCALLLLLGLSALPGQAAQVTLALESIRHSAFEVDDVSVVLDTDRRREAEIRLGRLRVAGTEYRDLRLHCADFSFDGRRLACPRGNLRREDERGRDRPALPFSLSYSAQDDHFEFALQDADLVTLSPLVKRLRGWQPTGKVDFRVVVDGARAQLRLALHDVGFASKEGDIVGKNIALTLNADAQRAGAGWTWQARLDWSQGELWRAPWRRAAGVRVVANGRYNAKEIDIGNARVEVDGIGALNAALNWDREREAPTAWGFVTEPLDLATAMREGVQPWLAGFGLPPITTRGKALFSAEWSAGRLQRFYAGLDDATLADTTGAIELKEVNANIPWEAANATDADFSVAGGRLGDLPLGQFRLPLRLSGSEARVSNLVAPVLDGQLEVEDLRVTRGEAGWQGEFSGGIAGISMPKLSKALGLPTMAGNITARVPRVSYADGTLALEGALAIEVFDGGIIVHQLRLIDAFTAQRRFVADVTARNLDLGMLTRTFSFGSIEGRFDADLHDLEMLGWKPLRFDVRIASSAGDYPRQLSFGALQDITALGEEGAEGASADAASAAIKRMPRREGRGFGYARIGIGGWLRDGVFTLDGISREGEGTVLMEGSGLPAVRIIGYNRRVDWEALVARFRDVIAGKPGVLIE